MYHRVNCVMSTICTVSTLTRPCQTVRIRDGAKASVFNFTTHLQRVSLSSLDYKDFIAYHKTVD